MKNEFIPEHKNRLDVEMVKRGMVRSRSMANDLISREKISVNGKIITKPSLSVSETDKITIDSPVKFVSRAGEKLDYALKTFEINPEGLEIIDIGSSTGGFTDCLLQNNVKKIIAIDVGTNQMVEEIKLDSRVELHESTDVRNFKLPHPVDIAVIDVSFISLSLVLPKAFEFLKDGGKAIALVKPQFEVGMKIAKKQKGIIKNEDEQFQVLEKIKSTAREIGFEIMRDTLSPITGEKGNREFLLLLQKSK